MSSRFDQSIPDGVLERARAGDRGAQAELYAAFGQPVFGLARRMLGRADLADDVLQETFIEVLKGLSKFRGEAPLGMWIRRIAVNECLMQLRSHWHRFRLPMSSGNDGTPVEEWLTADEPPPDKGLDVERALDALSPEARAVVWLHDVEGYTHVEIARLMHATPSFSKSQLARAYVRMRQWAGRPDEVEPCMPVLNS
ncbi:MAG TPA: RNA polymerase sigma factor [Gammaproteobacteria bacterium]|jgi:RNA polymerase sigma-70 factor (ECF subfamily)|nr:RNA polymerase sigma factor [Gammaproteobacteria bacterium]